jgi:Protein of unknown function (DUF2635).
MPQPHPTTFFIKPAEGLRIADPQTGEYLPENGRICPRSGFWLRRLKDGDVVEVKAIAPASASRAGKSDKE